jgi:hypothetical protein
MTERFYSISHLSTEQLRELYTSYRPYGWVDADYYELIPEGVHPPKLSDAEILFNMDAKDEHNYLVFMLDHEDEADGVMIGFGMSDYSDFAVYLHLPPELLNELVEKYALRPVDEKEDSTWEKHLANERLKYSLN